MPKPIYILPAHGIAEDRDSNLVTVFSIIEQVKIGVDVQEMPQRCHQENFRLPSTLGL